MKKTSYNKKKIVKSPIMLFHFLNLSQCVACMFGDKKIYKVTNLKAHSKGRYGELQRTGHLDYKVVFLYLWYHNDGSTEKPFNHNALGQLTNHNAFRFSEGGPSSNPELIKLFVSGRERRIVIM